MNKYYLKMLYWAVGVILSLGALAMNFVALQEYHPIIGAFTVLWCYFWATFYSLKLYQTYLKMIHTKEELKAYQEIAWGHPNSDQPVSKIIAQPEVKTLIAQDDNTVRNFVDPVLDAARFIDNNCVVETIDPAPILKQEPIKGEWRLDLVALENERWEWSRRVFTDATALGSLRKAEEEIYEIRQDIYNEIREPVEYADAIMAIFDSARRQPNSISPEEILSAMAGKIAINKTRKWKQNADGTYSHIK